MNKRTKKINSRLDLFAAHALQGLLASGHFTNETEDGPEVVKVSYLVDPDDRKSRRWYFAAVEQARMIAENMVKELDVEGT